MAPVNLPHDWMTHAAAHIPFIAMIDGQVRVNRARIAEAVIIAVIGGIVAGYVTMKQMEVKLDMLERKVDKIYEDIYRPSIPR